MYFSGCIVCHDIIIYVFKIHFVITMETQSLKRHQHGGDKVPCSVEQNTWENRTIKDFLVEPAQTQSAHAGKQESQGVVPQAYVQSGNDV